MGRAEARSAEIERPEGVIRTFHVSLNKVEPSKSVWARNLFSKNRYVSRLRVLDEMEPRGPKVPLVSEPSRFACRAERLAWATASPNRTVIVPPRKAKRVAPDADSGEEMALGVRSKVIWFNIFDAPFIHHAGGDVPCGYELTEPSGGTRIDLVVIGGHAYSLLWLLTAPRKRKPAHQQASFDGTRLHERAKARKMGEGACAG
jgi:hypothetical protein